MRIIGGTSKGRRLKAPKGLDTRPTTDRVKESVFNIINSYILDSRVLDLFGGTGNLGIEALSRGAKEAYFVDNNKNSIKVIEENIENTNFKEKSKVLFADAIKAIEELGAGKNKFDIIFMDPPYLKGFIVPCIENIDKEEILNHDGIVVIEHDIKDLLPSEIKGFIKTKDRRYGNTIISIYSREE